MKTTTLVLPLSCALLALATSLRSDEPKPKVTISQPLVREVADYVDFNGRVEASASVEVRARVTGFVDKVAFKPGAAVKRGDVLFEIDGRVYKLELARAEAELARAEARLKFAATNFERAKALAEKGTISQEELAKAEGDKLEAEAGVPVARTAVASARLNVDATTIKSPIDGKVGQPSLTPGNLARADDTVLVTVIAADPVYVSFDVDEATLLRLLRNKRDGKLKVKGDTYPVQMRLNDEKEFTRRGMVESVDNKIDPKTGTIRMRASIPNPDGGLIPGMFAHVRLSVSDPYKALLVNEYWAINSNDDDPYVMVVTEKNVLEKRKVTLGTKKGDLRVISSGLKAEEWVAVGSISAELPSIRYVDLMASGTAVVPVKLAMPTTNLLIRP